MNLLINEYSYEKLKKFHRVKSLKEIPTSEIIHPIFEDETISKIKENINSYIKLEQIRMKKIEYLTHLLDKIEKKVVQKKNYKLNRQ
ncbi:hypothetical protein [Silvanigrella aquatica]|uniref:Uncharacterized protein n=1 Tax=Silvanigrella aquatica TaxID=1915309 RepID=A0A1L4CYB9_9BACT|nr:hypothetical protein [Silvanigrella aquatica]APJ02944.1 hypothetical protein AXG55_03050 [Silvanigrella aquatica]